MYVMVWCDVFTATDYLRSLKYLMCICMLSPLTLLCSKRDSMTLLKRQDDSCVFSRLFFTPHLFYNSHVLLPALMRNMSASCLWQPVKYEQAFFRLQFTHFFSLFDICFDREERDALSSTYSIFSSTCFLPWQKGSSKCE